jgi:hypothetical protein
MKKLVLLIIVLAAVNADAFTVIESSLPWSPVDPWEDVHESPAFDAGTHPAENGSVGA